MPATACAEWLSRLHDSHYETADANHASTMKYLASPYSDPDPAVREQRFEAACAMAARDCPAGDTRRLGASLVLLVCSGLLSKEPAGHAHRALRALRRLRRTRNLAGITLRSVGIGITAGLPIGMSQMHTLCIAQSLPGAESCLE